MIIAHQTQRVIIQKSQKNQENVEQNKNLILIHQKVIKKPPKTTKTTKQMQIGGRHQQQHSKPIRTVKKTNHPVMA